MRMSMRKVRPGQQWYLVCKSVGNRWDALGRRTVDWYPTVVPV